MSENDLAAGDPLIQIVKRYFELLKGEESVSPELVESLSGLFDSGGLSNHNQITNILKPPEGKSNEDSRSPD
jgi:hypothetical protein